jgi:hypothetical protein
MGGMLRKKVDKTVVANMCRGFVHPEKIVRVFKHLQTPEFLLKEVWKR